MRAIVLAISLGLIARGSGADENDTPRNDAEEEVSTIREEQLVPHFELPDPLVLQSGTRVADAATWWSQRRGEILELFRTHVYGRAPDSRIDMRFEVTSIDTSALGGSAIRKEVTVYFAGGKSEPRMKVLLYLPADRPRPAPCFLGLNFAGNHAIHTDPEITPSRVWKQVDSDVVAQTPDADSRGEKASRWPVETILKRGYGLATIYYGDIDPDFDDGFRNGVHQLFGGPNENERAPDSWGSIGAWAWGLSRALDYFETDSDIDHDRVAVMGHSRLGKTALWAGAQDERFAMVISNNSGCGGAALSRRRYGETVARINGSFPHWFCTNFKNYSGKEDSLPVDQHMLVSLIAPRPVYIASAVEDDWADPRGEFLSGSYATPVYRLLGKEGLPVETVPEVGKPVLGTIGYHIRAGRHDVTDFDWSAFLNFADRHLSGKHANRGSRP